MENAWKAQAGTILRIEKLPSPPTADIIWISTARSIGIRSPVADTLSRMPGGSAKIRREQIQKGLGKVWQGTNCGFKRTEVPA
jgi:hypothetical protein